MRKRVSRGKRGEGDKGGRVQVAAMLRVLAFTIWSSWPKKCNFVIIFAGAGVPTLAMLSVGVVRAAGSAHGYVAGLTPEMERRA